MNIKELQQRAKKIIESIDKGKPESFPISTCCQSAEEVQAHESNNVDKTGATNSAILINTLKAVEEMGELSEDIINLHGGQRKRKYKSESELKENVGVEICDVIIVLTILAERLGIDLEAALLKKFEKEEQRWKDEHSSAPGI